MKPKVSIYATVYNNANRVRASMNSIINQFPDFDKNFEFVITDNFSDDGTYEILQEFARKHKNIKIIRAKCTRGMGRNIAYHHTSGKYVFYVDLDTIYNMNLSKILRYCQTHNMKNKAINGIMLRETRDKIGDMINSNFQEDNEWWIRSVARGIEIYMFPIIIGYNEIFDVKKKNSRESRYSRHFIEKIYRSYIHPNQYQLLRFGFWWSIKGRDFRTKMIMLLATFLNIISLKHKFNYYYNGKKLYEWAYFINFLSPRLITNKKNAWEFGVSITDIQKDWKFYATKQIETLYKLGLKNIYIIRRNRIIRKIEMLGKSNKKQLIRAYANKNIINYIKKSTITDTIKELENIN